jgi:hypothetical protein
LELLFKTKYQRDWGLIQVVEHMAQVSIPTTTKKKQKEHEEVQNSQNDRNRMKRSGHAY